MSRAALRVILYRGQATIGISLAVSVASPANLYHVVKRRVCPVAPVASATCVLRPWPLARLLTLVVLTRAQSNSVSLTRSRAPLLFPSLPLSPSLSLSLRRARERARGRAGALAVSLVFGTSRSFLQCDDAEDEWVVASCRSGARIWERACGRNAAFRWSRCPELPKRSDDRWKNAGDATTAAPRTVRLVVVAAPRARDLARCAADDRRRDGLLKRATVPSLRFRVPARRWNPSVRSRVVCTCVRLGVPAHNLKARALRSKVSGRSRASSRRRSRFRDDERQREASSCIRDRVYRSCVLAPYASGDR